MGSEQSFLDRISESGGQLTGGRTRRNPAEEDLEALMDSVRQHLVRLLNSRQGMSQAAPEYGLPSLVDLASGAGRAAQAVAEAIRATIEKHEPRLQRVRVSWSSEEESAARLPPFRVEGVLVGRLSRPRVWYETALSAAGEFTVSG